MTTTSRLTHLTIFQRIQPWVVIFSASLFFFFEFMQVNMFNALDPYLFIAFHLTNATQLGVLSACYMYANVIFLFPAGMLLDRFPTRYILIIAMAMSVTCAFLFSLSTSLWQAEVYRLITGIGGSFCLLACVRLASRWFPPKRMALVIGLVVMVAFLGGLFSQTPFTKLAELYGWKNTLRIDAAAGLFMLVVIIIFVRDFPVGTKVFFDKVHESLHKIGFWHSFTQVISNTQNWLGGLYTSLINLPIFLLGSTWGAWYLIQTQHLSKMDASYVTSMIFIGMIIGSPMVGKISDQLGRRKLPMIVGAIASFAVILAIMYLPNLSFEDLMILFLALGFVVSSQIIGYPLVAESNPSILIGAGEGLAAVFIMGGGFLIPVFPLLLNLHWNHVMKYGIPQYSLNNYHVAFLIMPVAFLLALIAAFVIRETHCKSFEDRNQRVTEDSSELSNVLENANNLKQRTMM